MPDEDNDFVTDEKSLAETFITILLMLFQILVQILLMIILVKVIFLKHNYHKATQNGPKQFFFLLETLLKKKFLLRSTDY